MQITVTIADELAAQARSRGISVEAYVQRLVEQALEVYVQRQALPKSPLPPRTRTCEQIESFFSEMAEGSEKLPRLSTESFTRESFY